MNKALLAILENDLVKANELLGRIAGADGLDSAMGLLNCCKELQPGRERLRNNVSNNAGLAHLLIRDYNKAKQTLDAVENPDATTAYLLAIIASRTNNFNDVMANLRTAIGRDRVSQPGVERPQFAKYRTNQDFMSIMIIAIKDHLIPIVLKRAGFNRLALFIAILLLSSRNFLAQG